ncbi:ATP-binding protein [Saccharicrinis sp. GN24d3]|uniref:ATP-binding protein n=1 Tax=Saccharicrinis sp. GN24d3 TaxID=3458416 RepID=UPI004036EA1B
MHEIRKKAIHTLKQMMEYPGRFSILVLGDSGVGKTHWISQNVKSITGNESKDNSIFIDSGLTEDSIEYWEDVFNKANNKFLIIEEVEKLSQKSQEIIFNIISTHNGKFGLKEKNLEIRIIFTSCLPIEKLRQDRRILNSKFYDRVSQFVVTFPNFNETQRDIYSDFEETWKKFFNEQHEYHNRFPQSEEFKDWLDLVAGNMYGNFRDLDKIVINWNFHQISAEQLEESKIFELVKKDFEAILKYPAQRIYDDNSFVFIEDIKYDEMLKNFRRALRNWSLNVNFNNKQKAAEMLGISHRSMERW